MSRADPSRPLVGSLSGDQRKPTVILLTSTVLMLTWRCFGSTEFYLSQVSPRLALHDDPAAGAGLYYFGSCFVLLGVVPALIVKLLFRESLADYGVQLGDRVRTIVTLLAFAPIMVLLAYLSSRDPAFLAEDPAILDVYPINKSAGASPGMFGFHAFTYVLFYLGWEFHFRGFLQFGLRDKLGAANALWIQVMASSMLHIGGKPWSETYGAIAGGILWGVIALRTRSLLSGLMQHAMLGLSLDCFLCFF